MSGSAASRAKAIALVRKVKASWAVPFLWKNHLGASHEFQLLDVLRDIRAVLTVIAFLLLWMVVHAS